MAAFDDALVHLRSLGHVRRRSWSQDTFIYLEPTKEGNGRIWRYKGAYVTSWQPLQFDILADDWELLNDD